MDTTHLKELLPLIIFMVIMFVMFYYMVIMPAKRRQKSHQDLVSALKESDEIVSAGGIYGKIIKLRDDSVDVEVAPNVRIKFDRRAIRRKAGDKEP
ncbi:MAG: preprotein translocase subunit YajC [Armatimonadetes bacterium]|nr:preprotein translocase subunit YajC [Armatimonadota bacterium]